MKSTGYATGLCLSMGLYLGLISGPSCLAGNALASAGDRGADPSLAVHATAKRAAGSDWLTQIGGAGAEVLFDVTETDDGRLCATGTFWASASFGRGEQISLRANAAQDIFVACYEADGEIAFATRFGAHRGDEPHAIAALPGGDIVVTGLFAEQFGVDGAPSLHADGDADIFVVRLDRAGREVWVRQFGGSLADSGNALAVSADGHIFLAGNFSSTLPFPQGERKSKLNAEGGRDAFVMKLSPNGEVDWAKRFGGSGFDEASEIAVQRNGDILVAGTFHGEAGYPADSGRLIARGHRDVFVLALTARGKPLWKRSIGGSSQDSVHGLVEDGEGRIHVAGNFQKTLLLPDGRRLESAGSSDIFLIRYSADGALENALQFGGRFTDQVHSLAHAADGRILLAGYYQGKADFDPGPGDAMLRAGAAGNTDAFLLELDGEGGFRAVRGLGGAGLEMVLAMAALANGDVAVAGLFNKDLTVRGSQLDPLENRGKTDIFLARLGREATSVAAH